MRFRDREITFANAYKKSRRDGGLTTIYAVDIIRAGSVSFPERHLSVISRKATAYSQYAVAFHYFLIAVIKRMTSSMAMSTNEMIS